MRHATFCGELVESSADGIAVQSSTGLRIGASYELELVNDLGSHAVQAIVRWCRLRSVRPGPRDGDFEPVFLSRLELA